MSVKSRAMDSVEEDLLAAFERLVQGRPKDRELRKAATEGRLKINVTNVAKEARRSRTLIGMDACRYPNVRERVLGFEPVTRTDRSAADTILRLREASASLRRERDQALAEAVAHFHARERAEREAQRWKEAFRRLRKAPLGQTGKVVELRPGSRPQNSE